VIVSVEVAPLAVGVTGLDEKLPQAGIGEPLPVTLHVRLTAFEKLVDVNVIVDVALLPALTALGVVAVITYPGGETAAKASNGAPP
jgi:hypothetical protein